MQLLKKKNLKLFILPILLLIIFAIIFKSVISHYDSITTTATPIFIDIIFAKLLADRYYNLYIHNKKTDNKNNFIKDIKYTLSLTTATPIILYIIKSTGFIQSTINNILIIIILTIIFTWILINEK